MTSGAALNRLSIDEVRHFQSGLLDWFAQHRRDLPWRRTRDPYRILVSEVMLQQTQVERVIPYYHAWLERFPSLEALTEAPTADVIRMWSGLGYNRRAVNLQRTARCIVGKHGSQFPRDIAGLLELPGVGPYTAGAIACFAFEQDVAFVDTNMRRVLSRYAVGCDPSPGSDRPILAVAGQVVPVGNGWTWNQALIEFGALQCTARKPACLICPLRDDCAAFPEIQTITASYAKTSKASPEEPFVGSNRYYRGRVVDVLRALSDGIALRDLGPLVRPDFDIAQLPWLYVVAQGLAKDGLLVIERGATQARAAVGIAEERGLYQVAEVPDDSELSDVWIRLPGLGAAPSA